MSFLSLTNIFYICAKLQNKHNGMNPAFVTRTHILQSGLRFKRIHCREPVLKSGIMGDLRMRGMPDQVGHDGKGADGKGGKRERGQT